MKINLIEKDKTLGSRWVIIPTDNAEKMKLLGLKKLDSTKEKVAEYIDKGHSFLQLGENVETALIYVSANSSDLINDVSKWLETNEWSTTMHLDNYESQDVWETNVAVWFDAAKNNEKFVSLIQAVSQEAVDTPSVKHWRTGVLNPPFVLKDVLRACQTHLMGIKGGKGKTGKRPEVVYQFVVNWVKCESDKHIHNYLVQNEPEYKKRYWEQYKTLAFRKGKKLPR